ncbi:GxxExxY protein [Adhaeretor mobilis]|nr:GxxExxY protein [Adhaeretor mobilis]
MLDDRELTEKIIGSAMEVHSQLGPGLLESTYLLKIVELKAVESILPIHEAQLLSYLKMSNLRVSLLLNFNVERLKHGITRMVNG